MKILLAADTHYCVNTSVEISRTKKDLPEGFFNHFDGERLVWHNVMVTQRSSEIMSALRCAELREKPHECIILGDLVNTNWSENVRAFPEELRHFQGKVDYVLGNHDIYLKGSACSLDRTIFSGEKEREGFRYRIYDGYGLLLLDCYVEWPDGSYAKELETEGQLVGVGYRPQDIDNAEAVIDENPDVAFVLLAHMQMAEPQRRIRKYPRIGGACRDLARMRERLKDKDNFKGIICAHQHVCHFQPVYTDKFQWILPAAIEFPCAYAIVEIDANGIRGEVKTLDESLNRDSLLENRWPRGERRDRIIRVEWD